ncbi:hypothetical protein WA026_012563 [Henosepilachna vigintioctopunctata]|uniref:E3 ubiquitin-protein ligase CHFR n=1 Tax=Henosepilachna vigintioctopunctata TaxID=420089 RepID=A0AAW1U6I1_9CUCU
MTEPPRLVNISNGQIIEINSDKFSVGRSLNCSYVLNSVYISRTHFILENNCGTWILKDNSSNGTLLNGHIINYGKTKSLCDGDTIKLINADTEFRFELFPRDNISITDEQLCEAFESVVYEKHVDGEDNLLNDHSYDIHISIGEPVVDEVIITEQSGNSSTHSIIPMVPEGLSSESNIREPHQRKRSSSPENYACMEKMEDNPNKRNKPDTLLSLIKSEVTDSAPNISNKEQGKIMNNFDMVEEELQCSVCSELFIKAVTLNCCHTFCSYCINQWRKHQSCCPICRKSITGMAPTLVLDNFIEKLVGTMDKETSEQRREMIASRVALENGLKLSGPSTSKNLQDSGSTTNSAITSTNSTSYTTVTISSDEDDEDFTDYTDDDEYYDHYINYNGMPGKYYGGYGRCYNCNRTGHWANGCPYR